MQDNKALHHSPGGLLILALTGPLSADLDGSTLELPPSKKARALLAYLAATRRPQRRDHLISLLWNETESARDGLRWSLSRLRKALEPDGTMRIVADRETVALAADQTDCDLWMLQRIATLTPALAPTADLIAAAAMQGDFLEGLDLPDCYEFRLWCTAERENLRRVQAAVLATLCDRLGTTEQALPYARRRILLEPTSECAHLVLLDLLIALGRLPEAETHVQTARQQFEAEGLAPPHRLIRRWTTHRQRQRPVVELKARPGRQRVHFCTTTDNVRVAYAVSGEGPRLLKAANWYSHLEHDLESPIWQHLIDALAQNRQTIRYDRRGCGLSDRTTRKFSFEEALLDLEAVGGLFADEPVDLVGFCSGAAMSIAYAARHPERVRRLVLIGSSALGWRLRGAVSRATNEHMMALTRQGWGLDNPAFRQVFTSLMFPEATPEQARWFNELQRISASPETAALLMDGFGDYDVTTQLANVRCPTLVLHSRDDAMVPMNFGRQCATEIPQAQFVTLPSRNHLILESEPAWADLRSEIEAFLAG